MFTIHHTGPSTLTNARRHIPSHGYIRLRNPLQAITSSPLPPSQIDAPQSKGVSTWGLLLIVFSYSSSLLLSVFKPVIMSTAFGTPSLNQRPSVRLLDHLRVSIRPALFQNIQTYYLDHYTLSSHPLCRILSAHCITTIRRLDVPVLYSVPVKRLP